MRFLTKYSCVYYVYIVFFVLSDFFLCIMQSFSDILYVPTARAMPRLRRGGAPV
jgi:hypothetical protein